MSHSDTYVGRTKRPRRWRGDRISRTARREVKCLICAERREQPADRELLAECYDAAEAALRRAAAVMRADLRPGGKLPDLTLHDHRGEPTTLSKLAAGFPLVLSFYRGYW